ncbi:MAG: hypothetical protein V1913_11245 [Fibrobacterota bacterium]
MKQLSRKDFILQTLQKEERVNVLAIAEHFNVAHSAGPGFAGTKRSACPQVWWSGQIRLIRSAFQFCGADGHQQGRQKGDWEKSV